MKTGLFSFLFVAVLLAFTAMPAVGEEYLSSDTGQRSGSNEFSQTITRKGPILLQDSYALAKLRRFNTERLAERVVHARGAGAYGEFTSSMDLSKWTAAKFLSAPNIKTEVFVRFSTVIHSKHSPETLRDPRGFAIKFKTPREGNWDLVGLSLPVFFIRDHIKFPDMVHALKPDPITNIQDPSRFFDFFAALGGQATHMLTYLFSDRGIPASYRFMPGDSVNAYKLVNAQGEITYVKFRLSPNQGIRNLTAKEAANIQAFDFNHATGDLYDAIKRGDYPRWTMAMQMMSMEEMMEQPYYPLDATKEWPEAKFPYMNIGTLVLNRVPDNFFLNSEQVAFSPANYLPGSIEPSEDRILQGRLISYEESQTHRHRSNVYNFLPVNRPNATVNNYRQDGVMVYDHTWNGTVNYEPSVVEDTYEIDPSKMYSTKRFCGSIVQENILKTYNFSQAGDLYRSFSPQDQTSLIENMKGALGMVSSMKVKNIMCSHFFKADTEYGMRISKAVGCDLDMVREMAQKLKN